MTKHTVSDASVKRYWEIRGTDKYKYHSWPAFEANATVARYQETKLIWDALQQMSDNRVEDVDGEPIPSPVLDALLEKFDAMFAAPADANSKEA